MTNFYLPNNRLVPEKSILDYFDRQTYCGNGYVLNYADTAAGSASETNVLYISNPSTSTKSVAVTYREAHVATASQTGKFKFYLNPTISATGTAATPVNLMGNSSTTASVTICATAPTASGGTVLDGSICLAFQPAIIPKTVILEPGNTLMMSVVTGATGNLVGANIYWSEIG